MTTKNTGEIRPKGQEVRKKSQKKSRKQEVNSNKKPGRKVKEIIRKEDGLERAIYEPTVEPPEVEELAVKKLVEKKE